MRSSIAVALSAIATAAAHGPPHPHSQMPGAACALDCFASQASDLWGFRTLVPTAIPSALCDPASTSSLYSCISSACDALPTPAIESFSSAQSALCAVATCAPSESGTFTTTGTVTYPGFPRWSEAHHPPPSSSWTGPSLTTSTFTLTYTGCPLPDDYTLAWPTWGPWPTGDYHTCSSDGWRCKTATQTITMSDGEVSTSVETVAVSEGPNGTTSVTVGAQTTGTESSTTTEEGAAETSAPPNEDPGDGAARLGETLGLGMVLVVACAVMVAL